MTQDNTVTGDYRKACFSFFENISPFFLFLILVFCFTWPLIGQLGSSIPGNESDAIVHFWTFHWIKHAIESGNFSLYTTDLFYPYGVSLVNQNIAWFNILIWLVLEPFFGVAPAYTLAILLLLAFNGFAIYLLVKDLIGSKSAALFAGVVVSTWPFINTHLQHANLFVIGFIPLSLMYIRRFVRENHLRDLILCGVFIGLIGIVRLQLLIMSMFLILTYFLYCMIIYKQRVSQKFIWKLIFLGVIISGILLPFVLPFLTSLTQENMGGLLYEQSNPCQFDLLAYLAPNPYHSLWGDAVRSLESNMISSKYISFVGFSVLLLTVVGLVGCRKESIFWFISIFLLVAFAIGPTPFIAGKPGVTMPFKSIYDQILIPVLRELDRFNVILAIPFSIVAAMGCNYLASKQKILKYLCPAVSIVLVLFEFMMVPFPSMDLDVPEWYKTLAKESGQFGILDIPMKRQFDEQYMLYQLVHGKSLVGGHVSRPPKQVYRFIEEVPLLSFLHQQRSTVPPLGDYDISKQLNMLNQADIRYLILHKDFLSSEEIFRWQTWLLIEPVYEDSELVVYRTLMDGLEEEFNDSPRISNEIQLVQSSLAPKATIQTGWIQVESTFLQVRENSDDSLCIALADKDGSIVQQNCEYRIMEEENGNVWDVDLIRRNYLFQVGSHIQDGDYEVVLYQHPGDTGGIFRASAGQLYVDATAAKVGRPNPERLLDISFQDTIALTGCDIEQSKDSLNIKLYWQALTCPTGSYKFFIHIIDEKKNTIIAQQDFIPGNWKNPTDSWQAGNYYQDELTFDLAIVPTGDYQIKAGIYMPENNYRLPTSPPYPDDAALIAVIHWE